MSATSAKNRCDLVVVGLGGMGSATLAQASMRGHRVLGIEQYSRGHDLGSSSGSTRIIRKAYFEDPRYVPLLVRAYELWRSLEARTDAKVLDLVGLLMVGNEQSPLIRGVRACSLEHDIVVDELASDEIAYRYPGTVPRPDECGFFERDAGIVFPEVAIAAHLELAQSCGADVRFGVRCAGIESSSRSVTLHLSDGTRLSAARVALCAGPWLAEVARELQLPLRVARNVQIWFRPVTSAFAADRFPAFFVDRPNWPAPLYGFPDLGDGVKAALHGFGETTSAETLDRAVRSDDIDAVKRLMDEWMPSAAGEYLRGKPCMYTLTPDENFIIDVHPADPRIVIAGGFSGHGFKFCSVVGEIVVELAFDGVSRHPIDFLKLERFS